jgi:predicted DNA-binding protein YlxM (UPF0122 family)
VHGLQHYENTFINFNRFIEDEIKNDKLKKEKAEENGIENYIIIDARYSEFDWIKNSILNSDLYSLLDMNSINLEECYIKSLKSKLILACNLWNNENKKVPEIAEILNVERGTVVKYLKRGNDLGLCDYDSRKESLMCYLNAVNKTSKSVLCINTNQCFKSLSEAARFYNLSGGNRITRYIRGEIKCAGKHPITGENLNWKYVN